jgi:hypothetical protein
MRRLRDKLHGASSQARVYRWAMSAATIVVAMEALGAGKKW